MTDFGIKFKNTINMDAKNNFINNLNDAFKATDFRIKTQRLTDNIMML